MTDISRGRLLRSTLLGLSLVACEPMTPSSNPFAPAPSRTSVEGPAAAPAEADPRFAEFAEPESISFEELQSMAPQPVAEAEPTAEEAVPVPGSQPAEQAAVDVPAAAPSPTPSTTGMGWAIRLVATVPGAQPPRAILGMPDGREIVVTPATLIPEAGLAVIAIGPGSVQLARFTAQGDHAAVEPLYLTPQY